MKPRKHAEVIKQWADGAAIQYRKDAGMAWTDSDVPAFVADYEYRVKPAREYPKSGMLLYEYETALSKARITDTVSAGAAIAIANYALCHAIDHGQVVTREEFDRVASDLKALQVAGKCDALRTDMELNFLPCDLDSIVRRKP